MPTILSASHLAPAGGFFEPQRRNNWSLEIALDDPGDQVLIVQGIQSFDGVRVSSEEISLEYANERRYVAGKTEYQTATLRLLDFVDAGTASAIIKWDRLVRNSETGSVGLARDYKKNADLVMGAPNGSTIRIWKLIGLWPQAVEYGEFDMRSSEPVEVSATLRYDRAVPGANLSFGLSGLNAGVLIPPL
jgi:hypothetical protein